jgi:hypothetical protein
MSATLAESCGQFQQRADKHFRREAGGFKLAIANAAPVWFTLGVCRAFSAAALFTACAAGPF